MSTKTKEELISEEEYLKTLQNAQTERDENAGLFKSSYDGQLKELYGRISNRPDFIYDLDGDALYRQYRDQYQKQAGLAARDAVGQAAALTGGYASTYAQSAGAQQYDSYLQKLSAIVPELYGAAAERYDAEGDRLKELYSLTGKARSQEYDTLSEQAKLLAQYGDFSGYRQLYGEEKGAEMENYWLTQNPDLALRLGIIDNSRYAAITGKAVSGGGGGGFSYFMGDGGTEYNPYGYKNAKGKSQIEVQALQRELGVTPDGIWGPKTEKAYNRKNG